MQTKCLTEGITVALSHRLPAPIPAHLMRKAEALGIKEIYMLGDLNLNKENVYGNVVVILQGGKYVDLDVPETVDAIISILS